MHKINKNPFRVIGIVANSAAKEIQSRRGKIQAYARVGKDISSEYDFEFLEAITRSEEVLNKAFSEIEQHKNIVDHSLFWFTNLNAIDETAIKHLINGNKEKAIEIWEKITEGREISSRNFSAFNNIGTLYFLEGSKEKLKQGIEYKIKLIESDHFQDFVHSVADEMYTIDAEKQVQFLIDDLLKQINGKYSTPEKIALFDGNPSVKNYLSGKFTEEPLHRIETQIEQSKKKRANDKITAYRSGSDLFANTKVDLTQLRSILGISDLKFKMISDKVAKEILQCSIDYFNECQDLDKGTDYIEEAVQLAKTAEAIAVNKLTKDRIKDNLATIEGMKDRELSQVIEVLQSVKDLYEENEREIRNQVKQMEETDILISIGHKSINWDAVEENIKNSINWGSVNDLLIEILTDTNLRKIKHSDKIALKKEFLVLANWIKVKSARSSVILRIIDQYKNILPKLPFNILSSDITNTDDKPLFNKFIRYVGLDLKVEVIDNKQVEFYIKYINPNGSIKRNAEVSPEGYSRLQKESLNTLTKLITFSGWGNANECTYDIGKHRIEIYVDEYLIHSKEYVVDLAPSEKIEKQLKAGESTLRDVNQTIYFSSETNLAKKEMDEIKAFKLFRGTSEKQRQIDRQQKKIDELKKRSQNEKLTNIKIQETKILRLKQELLEAIY